MTTCRNFDPLSRCINEIVNESSTKLSTLLQTLSVPIKARADKLVYPEEIVIMCQGVELLLLSHFCVLLFVFEDLRHSFY